MPVRDLNPDGLGFTCCSRVQEPRLRFKTLFWKQVLTPSLASSFTHLFLYDSDLQIHPEHWSLRRTLRLMRATGVHIMQPAPWGPGNGLHKASLFCHTASPSLPLPPVPEPATPPATPTPTPTLTLATTLLI